MSVSKLVEIEERGGGGEQRRQFGECFNLLNRLLAQNHSLVEVPTVHDAMAHEVDII